MVEYMLAARGVIVSHQTVRLWSEQFGGHFANNICKRSAGRLGDEWHLDEVVIKIADKKHDSAEPSIRIVSSLTSSSRATAMPRLQSA